MRTWESIPVVNDTRSVSSCPIFTLGMLHTPFRTAIVAHALFTT